MTTMKTITFKRIIWDQFLLLFLSLSFIATEGWLIFSLSHAKNPEPLLIAMVILVGAVTLCLITGTILLFIRKKDAITLEYPYIIIKTFKEKKISYRDIKDIRYRISSGGNAGRRGFGPGNYKSGTMFFYLNDGSKIIVKDIKEVANACYTIREEVLKL